MNINKLFVLTISSVLLLTGCDAPRRHTRHQKPKLEKEIVKCYKTQSDDNSWIWWYLIYDSNSRNYYYSYSPSPVTSYSSLNWQKSETAPKEIENQTEISEQEVSANELGQAEVEIASDYSNIPEDNSLDSMEGVPDSSDTSSDSGSSDSGSSGDSGGGDSGGGDSGGGGE